MNFPNEWDQVYKNNTHLSLWPWSDLVSYVMRYARPDAPGFRVCELGCGAGANIPFFKQLGVDYHAIEGSVAIVDMLREKMPELKDKIVVGDFTDEIACPGKFDLIVDRASLTHNSTGSIKKCLDLVHNKLRTGGKFLGIDWFSTACTDYQDGVASDAPHTRTGYKEGPFANIGQVHFSDKAHLLGLFHKFKFIVMEHKIVKTEIPQTGRQHATWNLVVEKPQS